MRFSYVAAGVLVLVLCLWMASGLLSAPSDDTSTASTATQKDNSPLMKVEYMDGALSLKSRDVVLQGQLEPRRHLMVRAETSSTVGSIEIGKGERVNAGDVIIKLALSGRETDLREANASVRTAASEQKAAASLRKQGLQSQVQLEQTQAQLEAARAQLARIQLDITNTNIKAPFSGVLNNIPVELGELVDRGAVVAELVDDAGFKVTAYASQQAVSRLSAGKTVEVKLITGETLPGKLSFISSVADSATRSFQVEADVENPGGSFAAGVSASLVVPVDQVEAMFITPSAIALGDDGELGVKIANEDAVVEFVPIELVSSTLEGAWVTGIPDNSRIITLGQGFVKEGQQVEPVKQAEGN